ncbi:hypothetical protein EWB00_004732, partial [Schistosoma japonicum]
QRKCLRLKANHVVETMIRDMYNKEFKDNAWLGKEWSVNDVTAVRLLEQSCLPWKMRMKVLACNRDLAFKILRKFKARFKTYPELWVWLKEVKPAHVAKGYVERVSIEQLGKLFLPHHPIVSPPKFNGVSLNNMLLSGLNRVSTSLGVLLRFCQIPIAIA